MYKNQLQELAQRSCFNLPSYTSIREGPDHAPRFKAIVNFNGETFDSPHYCSTLRQAEHAAAEVALNSLSTRGPSHSLAAKILDETGVYKNLLQEIAQRVGAPLPQYTTFRSGLGHQPVFTGIVELADIAFYGEPAKNKKQAEKNAALAAWSSLKQLAQQDATLSSESENNDEQEQIRISRALQNYRLKEKMTATSSTGAPIPFEKKFPVVYPRPTNQQPPSAATSKILNLIGQKMNPRNRSSASNESSSQQSQRQVPQVHARHSQIFPSAGAYPYVPYGQFRAPYHGVAQPVMMRTAVPVYSAPPLPPPMVRPPPQMIQPWAMQIAPPVRIRQPVVTVAALPPVQIKDPQSVAAPHLPNNPTTHAEETKSKTVNDQESTVVKKLEGLQV